MASLRPARFERESGPSRDRQRVCAPSLPSPRETRPCRQTGPCSTAFWRNQHHPRNFAVRFGTKSFEDSCLPESSIRVVNILSAIGFERTSIVFSSFSAKLLNIYGTVYPLTFCRFHGMCRADEPSSERGQVPCEWRYHS